MKHQQRRAWAIALLTGILLTGAACNKKDGPDVAQDAPSFEPGSTFAAAWQLQQAGDYVYAIKKYEEGMAEKYTKLHPVAQFYQGEAHFKNKNVVRAREAYFYGRQGTNLPEPMRNEADARYVRLNNYTDYLEKNRAASHSSSLQLPDAQAVVAMLADPRYAINGDQVYDRESKLTWQRCVIGQVMDDGILCRGSATGMTSEQVRTLNVPGWRVPTVAELLTLRVVAPPSRWQVDNMVFPGHEAFTRSAEMAPGSDGYVVRFFDNPVDRDPKYPLDGTAPVRLVRSGR